MNASRIVAGNWKMNKTLAEGLDLIREVCARKPATECLTIMATPYIHLAQASEMVSGHASYRIAAQDCSAHAGGAYTGEISAAMIASTGATHVIIGHSECRQYNPTSKAVLPRKIDQALAHGLTPIFCVGEMLSARDKNRHFAVVYAQLKQGLFHLSEDQWQKVIIAYEPVWAIGTGRTATAEQADEMHRYIRKRLAPVCGDYASRIPILYGGSVNPKNASHLFAQPNISGGLIGGASLKADDFVSLIEAMEGVLRNER